MTKCEAQHKACQNMLPKASKTQPGTSLNLPKSSPRASLAAEMHPKAPKNHPRGAQEAPKRGQEPPKSTQKSAKWHPRAAQEGPNPLQNRAQQAPGRVLGTMFAGSSVRQAPGSNFDGFLRRALDGRHAFRIGFSNTKRLSGLFRIASSQTQKNLEK